MTVAFSGKVWVFGDNLNTDDMYPGYALKMEPAEAARHVFYQVRPGWTDEVSPGDVVLAGKNFGLGSSRPVAVLFAELGVAGLVAEEFRLFCRSRGSVTRGLVAQRRVLLTFWTVIGFKTKEGVRRWVNPGYSRRSSVARTWSSMT